MEIGFKGLGFLLRCRFFLHFFFSCLPYGLFVYFICTLMRHFPSTFNIFSCFTYQKKKKKGCKTTDSTR